MRTRRPASRSSSRWPIPLKTALVGDESGAEIAPERLIILDQPTQSVTFENVTEMPLLSINRDFSAPVVLTAERRPHELERLAQADSDPFARYEAMQELMMAALTAGARGEPVDAGAGDPGNRGDAEVERARPGVQGGGDPAAERKPDRRPHGRRRSRRDPRLARAASHGRSGLHSRTTFLRRIASAAPQGDDLSPAAKGVRRLRTVALGLHRRGERGAGGKPRQGAVRRRRQHDRPPGRAWRARLAAGAASGRRR